MNPAKESLSRGQRLVQLAALKKLLFSGAQDSAEQAIHLALSLEDGPLLRELATGVSFTEHGIIAVEKSSPLQRGLKAELRNWTALRLGFAAGLLAGVRQLSYDATGKTDLSELWSGQQLESLWVRSGGAVEDLSTLATLPALSKLNLQLGSAADLAPLGRCTGLTELTLNAVQRKGELLELSALAGLPRLQSLEVRGLPVSGLRHLADFPSLRRLDVDCLPGE
ncbi:MAG: hypothetical protein RL653_1019 [Pseudomonadota bacterium]|jgi:hypothetical protein